MATWATDANTIAMGAALGLLAQGYASGFTLMTAENETAPDAYPRDILFIMDGQLQDQPTSIPSRQLAISIGTSVANSVASALTTGTTDLVFQSAYQGIARKGRDAAFKEFAANQNAIATTMGLDSLLVSVADGSRPRDEKANFFTCTLRLTWTMRHTLA
jgi:hypothetical protein